MVVDTGVLVSAFAFGGIPEKALRKVFVEAEIYVSPPLLEEYREVPGLASVTQSNGSVTE